MTTKDSDHSDTMSINILEETLEGDACMKRSGMDASVYIYVCFVLGFLLEWLVIWIHPIKQDHYDPD